jgi:hypothetical protein
MPPENPTYRQKCRDLPPENPGMSPENPLLPPENETCRRFFWFMTPEI